MAIVLKILSSILILFALYMGIKQGSAMVSGKPEMTELFGKWNFNKTGLQVFGIITMLGAVLVLFPKTFIWGNFFTAACILLIMAFHLSDRNIKGFAVELPFFLLSLLIIYLQHPLSKR